MLSRVLKKVPCHTYQLRNYVKKSTYISNDNRKNSSTKDDKNNKRKGTSNGDSGSSNDNAYMPNIIILSGLSNGSVDSDSFSSCGGGDGGSCGSSSD